MASFTFHTSAKLENIDNMQHLLRGKYNRIVEEFAEVFARSRNGSEKFTLPLGKKRWFSYKVKDPFTLSLFTNGYSTRYIVSPKREFIDKICSICKSTDKTIKSEIKIQDIRDDFSKKFTVGNAHMAVKLKLFQNGINCFPPRIMQGMKYLDKLLSEYVFTLDDLALMYNFTPTKTSLIQSKKPELEAKK